MVISIVVPVYKVEEYLSRCVDSILKQTFPDFELILVDDGSPDACGMICEQYAALDRRIHVIHQENSGLSAARNTGIDWAFQNSDSKWITFIDSDDWVHPDYLRLLYMAARNEAVDIVVGPYETVRETESVSDSRTDETFHKWNTEDYWVSHRTNATVAWGKLYKRSLFQNVRYPVGKYHEDEFVTYRLLFQYSEIAVVDTPIYYYFYNGNSISRLKYSQRLADIKECFAEHYSFFEQSPWYRAFRLETEKYAECLSNAIWLYKAEQAKVMEVVHLRGELRDFLRKHKKQVPFYQRKDIYIAAYPKHKWFIRGVGAIMQRLRRNDNESGKVL